MIKQSEVNVFTTALFGNGEVKWLDEHLFRLAKHALALGIPHPGDAVLRETILSCERKLASRAEPQLIRISLSKSGQEVTTRPVSALPSNVYNSAKIIVTDVQVHRELGKLKTSHQGPYQAARQVAEEKGAFECLLIDSDGFVVDGSRSSPLLFRENTLVSLEGGLQGITREKVLERARGLGIHTTRLRLKAEQIQGLILVAGSGIGLVPGANVDDKRITQLIEDFKIA